MPKNTLKSKYKIINLSKEENNFLLEIALYIDYLFKEGLFITIKHIKSKEINTNKSFIQEMINKNKLSRIKRIAEGFLVMEAEAKKYEKYRIDAVCIVMDENKKVERISYYDNVQL